MPKANPEIAAVVKTIANMLCEIATDHGLKITANATDGHQRITIEPATIRAYQTPEPAEFNRPFHISQGTHP